MRKRRPAPTGLLLMGLLLSGWAAWAAPAPPRPQMQMGKITVAAAQFTTVYHADRSTTTTLTGGVTVQSPQYHLVANRVDITSRQTALPGQSPIAHLVAYGDPARGTQVVGHLVDQNDLGRVYTVRADHAVYTPDDSRPQGGTLDLTGHPVVTVHDPQNLADDSVTIAKHIVILLGPKMGDYPQISGENGVATFTPLHQ